MLVEIVHYRDPDSSCDVAVFVDGERIADNDLTMISIDPGAGHSRGEWDFGRAEALATPRLSDAAHARALACFEDCDESKYIEDRA